MDEVTLKAYNNVGGVIDTIVLNGIISYKTHYYDTPLNQINIQTLDGGFHTYGNSLQQVNGELEIRGVDYTQGDHFKTWLRDKLIFQGYYLGIEIPVGVDLGKGDHISIVFADKCKMIEKDGDGVAKLVPPKMFNIKFNFKYTRSS
ncbi:MAG: hypothetical protein ACTSXT_13760 [Candidatus Helarchaeota archaeon]